MGQLTRAQIMTQAGLAAGNDQTLDFVRTWLDVWLQRTAKSWPWPDLKVSVTDLPLATGAASVQVGAGTFAAQYLHRILGNLLYYRTSDYKTRGRILVRKLIDGNPDTDERITDSTTRRGIPETCKVRRLATAPGKFTIYTNPVPDRDLLISFDAHYIPDNLGTGAANDTQAPWYMSDRTMIQACKCGHLEYLSRGQPSQVFDNEMMKLASMVVDDRDFDGEQAGDNQVMGLDPSVFVNP